MNESINVPYDRHIEAKVWQLFAAHALAGLNAFGYATPDGTRYSMATNEAVTRASDQADQMTAEFHSRFHFDPNEKAKG